MIDNIFEYQLGQTRIKQKQDSHISTGNIIKSRNWIPAIEKASIIATDILIKSLVKTPTEPLEFGWFYGSSDDPEYFTSVYIPSSLGVVQDARSNNIQGKPWDDKVRQKTLYKLLNDTFSHIVPYLAIHPETQKLGLQLISQIPEQETGFSNKHMMFLPVEQLILIKEISEYLPEDICNQIAGKRQDEIYAYILAQQNEGNTFDGIIRFDQPMLIGQYSMSNSYLPSNEAVIRILQDNIVDDGTIIGQGHVHYLRTDQERSANPYFDQLDELIKIEEVQMTIPGEALPQTFRLGHERFISPPDAEQIIFAKDNTKELSRGKLSVNVAVKAIFVFDPNSRQLLTKTYFDVISLSNNSEDQKKFVELAVVASVSTRLDVMKAFYELVAKYTTNEYPAVMDVR